jgi:hypothetical protein
MKKLFLLALSLLLVMQLYGQTQGISYQAVILDTNPEQVPGVDISNNYLPNHPLFVRFSILDTVGTIDYQEEQSTTTDAYGMISLTIGKGTPTATSPNVFTGIDWNGTLKKLKVDISLSTANIFYTDFSLEELSFVPYAYHKNITATGTLSVNGATTLKSRLDVTNGSPTFLSGNLNVDQSTLLKKDLTVDSTSNLNGQVTINANITGGDTAYSSYPLRVQGGTQGISVKITGSRSNSNNFVTFWDDGGVQGSIQGETTSELLTDPDYIFDNVVFANQIVAATTSEIQAVVDLVGASTSSTACVGLGACVTSPVPSLIVAAAANVVVQSANLAIAIAQPILYNVEQIQNIGVTYSSGAGDYAEWLPKSNVSEKFYAGDVVAVSGGSITKSTLDAYHFMVVSYNPIVLGNMPVKGKEANYEKVAFMGQVPVKVIGKVKTGDYLLPSGKNDGSAVAVSPDDIQSDQYQKIVGVAWSKSDSTGYNFVNGAVGLNSNDVAKLSIKQEEKIKSQQEEINKLKEQINSMNVALVQLIPNYSAYLKTSQDITASSTATSTSTASSSSTSTKSSTKSSASSSSTVSTNTTQVQSSAQSDRTVIYYSVTRDQIVEGIDMATSRLKEKGVDISKHPFFTKMNSDATYKEAYINNLKSTIQKELDAKYQQDSKTGASVIKN